MKTRVALPSDFPDILALNRESEHFLSPLSAHRLEQLHGMAELHRVVENEGNVVAFLLAFRERASYDSINYLWFARKFERFLYVDRVVVSETCRCLGAGRHLYREVFAHALATDVPVVTCEYDIDPPNPASERFHAHFGFTEFGRQSVANGKKSVSLQVARVTSG